MLRRLELRAAAKLCDGRGDFSGGGGGAGGDGRGGGRRREAGTVAEAMVDEGAIKSRWPGHTLSGTLSNANEPRDEQTWFFFLLVSFSYATRRAGLFLPRILKL